MSGFVEALKKGRIDHEINVNPFIRSGPRVLVDVEEVYQPASLPLCDRFLESHCGSIACRPGWSIKIENEPRRLLGQAVLRCEFVCTVLPRPLDLRPCIARSSIAKVDRRSQNSRALRRTSRLEPAGLM